MEAHQRPASHMASWFKRALCEIQMVESVMGLEHGRGRRVAIAQLEQANEKDPAESPDSWARDLREALRATW
eukprot:8222695-Pyramimonas_sp.AAC.1